ncbi:MAG TPA: DUF6351 family protein, partial [Mycobacteriales bacterium]|nr:DUF6351 family protein [Mycobacteriales bacterium]
DGSNAIISFPDMETTFVTDADCLLLERVFRSDQLRWTEPKQEAVTGFRTGNICADWVASYAILVDPKHCDPTVPADQVYDARKNPGGVRCALQDDQVNIWGRDPATGFARRPLDNNGLQYGLIALRTGAITPADFVALNAAVGGLDIDGNPVPQRMDMGTDVARIAYDTGRVTGRGALNQTPIIDNHPNLDLVPNVDVHDDARPFMARARLDANLVDPRHCDPTMPADQVYDPKKNPGGVRCALQDDLVNLWGRDPATGFARRPLDNTGVQYGLAALRSGIISPADFVALNTAVGGLDIDGNPVPQRMEMGADVARIAYDTGRVTGRGAIDQTAIIDNHPNLDLVPNVDVHDDARPFAAAARMDA